MTDRPRIALDHRPARLGRSGIPRVVRELATALARREDLDLHLFGHAFARPRSSAAIDGATLHASRLPGRALPWLARVGIDAARLAGGAALFHWTDYVFPPVRRRVPVVWTLHDLAFLVDPRWHGDDAARLTARARAAAARAARVVCPTEATAAAARALLGVGEERLRVVPWGADHLGVGRPVTDPAVATLPPDGHLLMVGTLEPRKNHLRLLEAWRRLGRDRPRLAIVGRAGWDCDAVVAAIRREIDAGGPLTWHADADDAALTALFAGARALVYPSLHEGFGLPAAEGLARGLPVVAGDHAAIVEATLGGAIHVDATSVDAIEAGLRAALEPAAVIAAAAAGARLRAARRWADTAAAYAAIYRECLGLQPIAATTEGDPE